MTLTLNQSHDRLSLRHAHAQGIFLYLLACNDLESFVHYALAFPNHDYLVDHLGVRSPIFWQVQLLPLKVVKLVILKTETQQMIVSIAVITNFSDRSKITLLSRCVRVYLLRFYSARAYGLNALGMDCLEGCGNGR